MRKIFTFVVFGFCIISLILILVFDKDINDSISIVTIKQTYARMMTEDEQISFTIYVSQTDSFITDKANITHCMIKSDTNEIALNLSEIRESEYQETLDEITYHTYIFDFDFNDITLNQVTLDFNDAFLYLDYQNSETITLEIGDVFLNFSEINNQTHLDMFRMYGVYQKSNDKYLNGIVLGFNNRTLQNLDILSFDLLVENVKVDINAAKVLSQAVSYMRDIELIMGDDYQSIGTCEETGKISIADETLIFVPLKYTNDLINLNRFPIKVNYEYNDEVYVYSIDDFQFNSIQLGLEVNRGILREFVYYY